MRIRVGSRYFGWIIGIMVLLSLAASPTLADFVVQPIIRRQQVAPGARGVLLNFKLENLGDATTGVALRLVDLAKDSNGIWMEADPNDSSRLALRSCRTWLACPAVEVQLEPNQVAPIPITVDIPPDANGLYYAALIAGASGGTSEDAPWGGAMVQIQYLAPIILDVQASAADAATTAPAGLSGRVVDLNGRPVAGAQVALAGDRLSAVMLRNGALEPRWPDDEQKARFTATDAEGRFRFEGEYSHPFFLFAAHATGFAAVMSKDFQENREIRLEPWGRIEGQLAKGHRGADGRVWMLGLLRPTWAPRECDLRYDMPCDEDGRFVFERVPAGWFNVGYLIAMGDHCEGLTSRTPVLVKAGETARVKVGGEGRPVVGRFVAPASYGQPLYFGAGPRGLYRTEGIERDREKARQSAERQQENDPYVDGMWMWDDPRGEVYSIEGNRQVWLPGWDEWRGEDFAAEGTVWSDADWRSYAFYIRPDGSFRIEDVVPGRYELRLVLDRAPRSQWIGPPLGRYRGAIEVPPMAGPRTDQPYDVGALTLDMFGVGGPAPLFEDETIEGKPIRLIDYRGKFVLLGFSMPRDDIDANILDCLKELHGTYGSKGTLQVISRFYGSRAEVKRYAAEHEIDWPVICCSGGGDCPDSFARQYGVRSCTNAVLIDPEGKIVATRLWGMGWSEELMSRVQDALEQQDRSGMKVP